uniref:Uncharacterized protein n=1 Tax=Anguilla anguilla TaxID=7936 RepID=A0A0E9SMH4_ANGAN
MARPQPQGVPANASLEAHKPLKTCKHCVHQRAQISGTDTPCSRATNQSYSLINAPGR